MLIMHCQALNRSLPLLSTSTALAFPRIHTCTARVGRASSRARTQAVKMGSLGPSVSASAVSAPAKKSTKQVAESQPLLTPYQMGPFKLGNRVVYAPLTRCRSPGHIPQKVAVEYYTQRASQGILMVTEATGVDATSYGYPFTPGISTAEEVEAWKPIVEAVKAKGATFFCQIWNCGRVSHQEYQPDGAAPPAPSAIAISSGQVYTESGKAFDFPVPREMTKEDIKAMVQSFRQAARNSLDAGFDGVEIHGAHGYLLEQFLSDNSNKRTDEYGGSLENRMRFALEVVDAVIAEVGADKVGIRLSPFIRFMDSFDSDPITLYTRLAAELGRRGLLYVHFVEPRADEATQHGEADNNNKFIEAYREAHPNGTVIAAGGYNQENGNAAIASGHADLIAYGRIFLANPDLPKRFALHAPLNKYNRDTFYTQGLEGYTDYPFLEDTDGWKGKVEANGAH